MKKLSLIVALLAMMGIGTKAQPVMSQRAMLRFPTYLPFEDSNVEWQRDVYREIDLTKGNNGGLGLANEPNIFSTVFLLALNGSIPVYEYALTGNEIFTPSTQVDMEEMMKNFQITYIKEGGRLEVDDDDIPSTEVSVYYLREKTYYDKANSSFRTRVAALCPVLVTESDSLGGRTKYPLFWVTYDDVEPYLMDFLVYSNNHNKAATMTAADYFTRHLYHGSIYKTFNTQGNMLDCGTDSMLAAEQQRTESELVAIREHTYSPKSNFGKRGHKITK